MIMNFRICFSCLSGLLAIPCGTSAGTEFSSLRQGKKIAIVGDSITQGGSFVAYLQSFLAHTGVKMYNAGFPGDHSAQTARRIGVVLEQLAPDRVGYAIGINDARAKEFCTPEKSAAKERVFTRFRLASEKTMNQVRAAGKDFFLITPAAYNQYGSAPGKSAPIAYKDSLGVETFCRIEQELAGKYSLPLLELHSVMKEIFQKFPSDPVIISDREHPCRGVHVIMAAVLARQMGIASEYLGNVVIRGNQADAAQGRIAEFVRTVA